MVINEWFGTRVIVGGIEHWRTQGGLCLWGRGSDNLRHAVGTAKQCLSLFNSTAALAVQKGSRCHHHHHHYHCYPNHNNIMNLASSHGIHAHRVRLLRCCRCAPKIDDGRAKHRQRRHGAVPKPQRQPCRRRLIQIEVVAHAPLEG